MKDLETSIGALTAGLRDLPADSVIRVGHFLREYLGSTQHPVPFGGREREFARLENWLTAADVPPYALLAAPAGRGKSALLLRWCQRLLDRSDLAVVYFPVSIRFRTNLAGVVLPSLVALLARLHGEQIPADPNVSEEIWRGLLSQYLTRSLPHGRRLLLVLDGVDEAADWSVGPAFFPEEPPAGLRVVLSARYLANDSDASAWLRRLGWTRPGLAYALELYPLDRAGIAGVLAQMGFPLDLLGARVDIVSELHRLSEGDPLLIRLYVDDLWERGEAAVRLSPSDLQAIHPGLVGYFERWWNDQRQLWSSTEPERELAVVTILKLLAGALGPLSKGDLLSLAPREAGLDLATIETSLLPLRRFVIGDGLRQGYVFSHPRLANYFLEERLDQQERQEVELSFLTWGEQTLAALESKALQPEEVSSYIVQYYGAHLERAGAPPHALLALVSNGWRRAWEKLDRANAGFLGDSERAWRAAERANVTALSATTVAPYLGAEVRSLLCQVSVNSITSNISPRLMLEAVKTGVWTPAQGLACIRLISEPVPRVRELAGLASYTSEPVRTEILQEALDTVSTIKDEYDRLDILVELAPRLSEGLLAQILADVPSVEDEADRAGLLTDLGPALTLYPGLIEQALVFVQGIEEEEYLALALLGLTPYFSRQHWSEVLRLLATLQDERYRVQVMEALIPHLPSTLLVESLREARAVKDGLFRVRLLVELTMRLPEYMQDEVMQEALSLLREISDPEYRVEALLKIAPCLSEERLHQTLQEIQQIWDEGARARALGELLPYLLDEQLAACQQLVQTMRNEEYRTAALLHLLPRLSEEALEAVLDIVQITWDEGRRVEILAALAPRVSEALLPRLLELISAINDPGYRVWLLAELETSLVGKLHVSPLDIVRTFRRMKDEEERLQTLLAIIPRISNAALSPIFSSLLPDLFSFSWSVKSVDRRADILAKLGGRLPDAWLPRVLEMTRDMHNETYQVQVLIALAPRVNETLLSEVLNIVRAMRDRARRSQVLEVLVSSLPAEHKSERVREMLQVLQIIKDEDDNVRAALALSNYLPAEISTEQLTRIFSCVRELRSENNRLAILKVLAPHLRESFFADALWLIQTLQDEEERANGLIALAPFLPDHLLSTFLNSVLAISRERWRVAALAELAAHVSKEAFLSIFNALEALPEGRESAPLLSALVPHASEEMLPLFWEAVRTFDEEGGRVWLLGALAQRVTKEVFARLWSEIWQLRHEQSQMWILRRLVSHLTPELFSLFWETLSRVENRHWRMQVIALVALDTPTSHLSQVLESTRTFSDETMRLATLKAVLEHAPADMYLSLLRMAYTLGDTTLQRQWLLTLAARVPESAFLEFWQVLHGEKDQTFRRVWLMTLAPRVPESFLERFMQAAKVEFQESEQLGILLELLAPCIPASFVENFLQTLRTLPDIPTRVRIWQALIPTLTPEGCASLLEDVLALPEQPERAHVLEQLILYLSAEQSAALLQRLGFSDAQGELLENEMVAQEADSLRTRHALLNLLIPRLPIEQLRRILPGFLETLRERRQGQFGALLQLAPRVPAEHLPAFLGCLSLLNSAAEQNKVLERLLVPLAEQGWRVVLNVLTARLRETDESHLLFLALQYINPAVMSASLLYPVGHVLLRRLARLPRRDALTELTMLIPALSLSGGESAISDIFCSILELGCWWP